ncbi:MAG: nuclear transport factor 2 family protein [Bacteroidales bacterium]
MEKIEIVKSYWIAEASKDLKSILDHFHSESIFTSPGMQLNGRENIKQFYEGMVNNFAAIKVVPTHWIESGNEIAVQYDCELVRLSGEKRFAKGFNLFKITDGHILSLNCYFNPADF